MPRARRPCESVQAVPGPQRDIAKIVHPARTGFSAARKDVTGLDTAFHRDPFESPGMNDDAWNQLAERSRVLVHHASRLMGVLTHPAQARDPFVLGPIAAESAVALAALLAAVAAAPEFAAHLRTLQRFDIALAAWRRSVVDASPLAPRYQTALLQQAAQVVTSCLHVESTAAGESARMHVTRRDVGGFTNPPP